MTVVNTNIKSLVAANAMAVNERNLQNAMTQLSTGSRINSARDDAAGLAISLFNDARVTCVSVSDPAKYEPPAQARLAQLGAVGRAKDAGASVVVAAVKSKVYPSAGAANTACVPTMVAAPGLFSTTAGLPTILENCSAHILAATSTAVPAGNTTMIL